MTQFLASPATGGWLEESCTLEGAATGFYVIDSGADVEWGDFQSAMPASEVWAALEHEFMQASMPKRALPAEAPFFQPTAHIKCANSE